MNDQEKSVLLARAMGWWFRYGSADEGELPMVYSPDFGLICVGQNTFRDNYMPDFYLPENMHLAWRVLNHFAADLVGWLESCSLVAFAMMPPANIQRLWLDKILELAIEAGLVEVDDGD